MRYKQTQIHVFTRHLLENRDEHQDEDPVGGNNSNKRNARVGDFHP